MQDSRLIPRNQIFTWKNSSNKEVTREIKVAIPITLVPEKINYLEINLSKEVKDFFTGKEKTVLKVIMKI